MTEKRPSCCGFSAFVTLFRIKSFYSKILSVFFPMTIYTESDTIINICYQFWICRNVFNMMCVQIFFTSAFLAGIIVSFINSNAPLSNTTTGAGAFGNERFAAFPSWAFITHKILCSPNKRTFFRACFCNCASISFINNSANRTGTCYGRASVTPTRFATIFRGRGFIKLHFVRLSTHFARLFNLSVFHAMYYNTFNQNYGAVILERFYTATGITPELTD